MRLFDRAWRLQVGELDLSELSFAFKAQRSCYGYAGTLDLEVRNPSEEHRRQLVASRRYHTFVEVMAGYREGMSTIFRGDLRRAVPVRDGTTWTVKITAGDGEHGIRSGRVARSFSPEATVEQVVRELAGAMGVGVGNAIATLRGANFGALQGMYPEGVVLYGPAAAELTRLCSSVGYTWSVQDGVLQVLPRGGALAREAPLLSAETGLLGAPEVVNRRTLKLKTLLIPGLIPGQQVVLDSALATGAWRISQGEYAGDTHGQDWGATLTVHRPRPPLVTGTVTPGATG